MLPKWSKQRVWVGFLTGLGLLALFTLSALGHSFGDAETFLPLVRVYRAPPPPATTAKLLITELVYNPLNEPAKEPAGEWVEIYNPGEVAVLLSVYKLGDEETFGGDEGMMQFPGDSLLDPGEVIVVANQGSAFLAIYGFPPDFEMRDTDPQIPDMQAYPVWSTGKVELVNLGDEVLLLDGEDSLVDALS